MSTTAFPDLQATIEEMIAEGEKVMVRWTQSATHQSEFMGIAPTGGRVTFSGINIFRVRGGKIAEDTPHWDFSVILRQLHEAPQPAQSEEASPARSSRLTQEDA
jgi:predicted ester cyclase